MTVIPLLSLPRPAVLKLQLKYWYRGQLTIAHARWSSSTARSHHVDIAVW
jgi:hypothetical protein